MAQQRKLGSHKTTVINEGGMTKVIYHATPVVSFDKYKIILDTGGWWTATTKTRINQASNQFGLGYHLYQKDYSWYVDYNGRTYTMNTSRLTLERN